MPSGNKRCLLCARGVDATEESLHVSQFAAVYARAHTLGFKHEEHTASIWAGTILIGRLTVTSRLCNLCGLQGPPLDLLPAEHRRRLNCVQMYGRDRATKMLNALGGPLHGGYGCTVRGFSVEVGGWLL